jgi:alpha,alpha-trehalase
VLALAGGCGTAAPAAAPPPTPQPGVPAAARYDPSRDPGPLFHDVQTAGIFPDSKTFVDARPLRSPAEVAAAYAATRGSASFDLKAFVERNFELPRPAGEGFRADTSRPMEAHLRALWPALTRPADPADPRSSLVPLPNSYVVPGGRFREVYYWDSYFTMLGLVRSGRTDLVRSMLDNFAHLVRTVGHVPNGNRTYYLSRSQPPFLAAMVGLYARAADTAQALRYLDALEAEHAFWMEGADRVAPACRTARCSTATGTTGRSPGRSRTARTSRWGSRSRRSGARRSTARCARRRRAAGTFPAAGCATRATCGRWKRRRSRPWT